MLTKVSRSKILFFDSNPIGRILARFSKDIAVIDFLLPNSVTFATFGFFRCVTVVMVLAVIQPYLIIVFAVVAFILYKLYQNMIRVLNEMQR